MDIKIAVVLNRTGLSLRGVSLEAILFPLYAVAAQSHSEFLSFVLMIEQTTAKMDIAKSTTTSETALYPQDMITTSSVEGEGFALDEENVVTMLPPIIVPIEENSIDMDINLYEEITTTVMSAMKTTERNFREDEEKNEVFDVRKIEMMEEEGFTTQMVTEITTHEENTEEDTTETITESDNNQREDTSKYDLEQTVETTTHVHVELTTGMMESRSILKDVFTTNKDYSMDSDQTVYTTQDSTTVKSATDESTTLIQDEGMENQDDNDITTMMPKIIPTILDDIPTESTSGIITNDSVEEDTTMIPELDTQQSDRNEPTTESVTKIEDLDSDNITMMTKEIITTTL